MNTLSLKDTFNGNWFRISFMNDGTIRMSIQDMKTKDWIGATLDINDTKKLTNRLGAHITPSPTEPVHK